MCVDMNSGSVTLLLGGARSGKSRQAQAIAEGIGGSLVYLATAQAFDDEMTDRIARHRADRGAVWRTVECPIDLPAAVSAEAKPGSVLLVDCLTLWASNLLLSNTDTEAAIEELIAVFLAAPCPIVVVANEVGMGIVPDNALARRFRDVAGVLNQRVAAVATEVFMLAAGLTLRLK